MEIEDTPATKPELSGAKAYFSEQSTKPANNLILNAANISSSHLAETWDEHLGKLTQLPN
jgi:hypothetical protein